MYTLEDGSVIDLIAISAVRRLVTDPKYFSILQFGQPTFTITEEEAVLVIEAWKKARNPYTTYDLEAATA